MTTGATGNTTDGVIGSAADGAIGDAAIGSAVDVATGNTAYGATSDKANAHGTEQFRLEHDTLGEVKVPVNALWGAQTERSRQNFCIGNELMPSELLQALLIFKKAAALTNVELGALPQQRGLVIAAAVDEILEHWDAYGEAFPLHVWQTGSATQTNMNVNEVICHVAPRVCKRLNFELNTPLHPNDDVNKSQSSNDVMPTAAHLAAAKAVNSCLLPALTALELEFSRLEMEYKDVIKCGRTHLQDAVPLTFGQEVSAWRCLVKNGREMVEASLPWLYELAAGGTAVGTGLNAAKGFDELVARQLASVYELPFVSAPNKFAALSGKDALCFSHGALKTCAANLMKIANDIRWLASGPRCGLGEITLPANEPGSSIMPGKVNPTQCEALTMVCVQVMGNDTTLGFAASQGNFELNVFLPVIAYNYLQSVRLLSDSITSFTMHLVHGIKVNKARMEHNVQNSLMLVTSLTPYLGYEKAARVAHHAYEHNSSLKEAAVALGYLDATKFDELVHPEKMV